MSKEGQAAQAPFRIWLSGITGDPISGDLGSNFEGNLNNYLMQMFKISDNTIASPILRFQNDQIGYNPSTGASMGNVPKDEALLGAKIQDGDNKAVFLNMTPFLIVNQNIRTQLVDNIFVWLNSSSSPSGPEVTLSKEKVAEWEERDVTTIAECKNCSLQLACGGGCAAVAFNKTGRLHSPDCRPIDELIGMGISTYMIKENE